MSHPATSHRFTPSCSPLAIAACAPIAVDDLAHVVGGADPMSDGLAAAKRAAESKPGHGNLDLFGYNGTSTGTGVGAELRQRIAPSTSLFVQGRLGQKDNKPDSSVMGGVRFEW